MVWHKTRSCRLTAVFSMTAGFFLVELVVGYITNSMALVADSFHMLSDVLALVIAFLSVRVSRTGMTFKFGKNKNTFGWARAEVLGALVNSVFLLALCFSIFVEAIKRLYHPEELHDVFLILGVGVVGLIINVVGLLLLKDHGHGHSHGLSGGHGHGHSHGGDSRSPLKQLVATEDAEGEEALTGGQMLPTVVPQSPSDGGAAKRGPAKSMNMRGVFLHVLSDALGSVIVIISALIVWLTDWEYQAYVDPLLSMALVLLISCSTWPLLRESALILLQTVPTHIQVEGIQERLLRVDGVLAVHEFHVWQLAGERIIASAHIRCRNLHDYMVLAEKVKKMFHEEGIHSTTIQPEFSEVEALEGEDCVLDCPPTDGGDCLANTCCGPALAAKTAEGLKRRDPAA